MESTPDKAAVKTIEMTTEVLKHHINLAGQGFRGLTPIFKLVQLWVKCCEISSHATEKLFTKGRGN